MIKTQMIKIFKREFAYCNDCGKKTDMKETEKEISFTCENCGKIVTFTK